MIMKKLFLFILPILLISSCSKNLEIKNFDSAGWIADKSGKNGERIEQLDNLKEQKTQFIECSESSVKELLGYPDDQNLLPRMGRRYYYYVTPSYNDSLNKSNPVIVEFEHRGLVRLVIVPNSKTIKNSLN